ncbi:hypothetical protein PsorP6_011371 [Peronosclerospora sorghi]|uniref:Uncharacterized protein n=1 Tax=Peronosclerospora sorghi TaxID=230839 RepID=A0ACC0WKE9_9STRA|nr:hypothetical protein PsorP6_011371 [Peronosclerospora sorghi]
MASRFELGWERCRTSYPYLKAGLQFVPNIHAELLIMASMAVGKWSSGSTGAGRTIGDNIMAGWQGADVYLTPRFDKKVKDENYYGSRVCVSRAAVVRSVHGSTLSAAEHQLVWDASEAMRTSLSNARWHDGAVVYGIDTTTITRVEDLVRITGEPFATIGSVTRHWIPRPGYTKVMELCLKLATLHKRQSVGEGSEMLSSGSGAEEVRSRSRFTSLRINGLRLDGQRRVFVKYS